MTKLKQTITMCIAFLLCTITLSAFSAEIKVKSTDNLADSVKNATDGDTLILGNGLYTMSNGLRIEKEITLIGESNDSSKVIIDVGNTVENAGNGVHVLGSNVTLQDLTIKSTSTNPGNNAYALKIDTSDNNNMRSENVKLINITVTGGKSVSILRTEGAIIDGLLVNGQTAPGASIAISSSTVTIKNTTTIGGAWGDIGVMWENPVDKPWYTKPIKVTLGENNHFTAGSIYSEAYSVLGNLFAANPFDVEGVLNQADQMVYTIRPYAYIARTDSRYMYYTIADAMKDAKTGETIHLTAGTFKEAFEIKSDVNVEGKDSSLTIIEGPTTVANTVTLGVGSSLKNVTVTRAGNTVAEWGTNGAMQGVNLEENTTLENCIITKNRNGVFVYGKSGVTIKNNLIESNRTGIHLVNDCGFSITDNKIINNFTVGLLCRYEISANSNLNNRVFSKNTVTGNWYSQVENRWDNVNNNLNLEDNDYGTEALTYTYALSSGEPGYADQIPQWAGGNAVAPAFAPTFVFPTQNGTVYPSLASFKLLSTYPGILVFDTNKAIKNGYSSISNAMKALEENETIALSIGTYEGNFAIDKSVSIYGFSRDSVKIKGLITVPNGSDNRKVITLSGFNIESEPANGFGMIDITGSNIDLNVDSVSMKNMNTTSNGRNGPDAGYGIVINDVNSDSVLINFMNSSIELTRLNHRAIAARRGENHKINVINSHIFSPNGAKNLSDIYGVYTWTANSELNIDNSIIDVNYYAACAIGAKDQKLTIKNSKLTAWAAVYVWSDAVNTIVRIDSCQLKQRCYWNGGSDGFGAVVLQNLTNVDAIIHNTSIGQTPSTPAQDVISLGDKHLSGKLALTGSTTLTRNADAGPYFFLNTYATEPFEITVEPTVKMVNQGRESVIEVVSGMDDNGVKKMTAVTTNMHKAFYAGYENDTIYGNGYPKTPAEIAEEINANTGLYHQYSNVTLINNADYVTMSRENAIERINANQNVTFLKYTYTDNKAHFEVVPLVAVKNAEGKITDVYDSITKAIEKVPAGGVVSLIAGTTDVGNLIISKPVTIEGTDSTSIIKGYIRVNSDNVTIQNVAMQFTSINDEITGREMVWITAGNENVTLKNINFLQHTFDKVKTVEVGGKKEKRQAKAIYTGVGVGVNVIGCTVPTKGYERAMWNNGFKTVAGKRWQIRDNDFGPNSNIEATSRSFDIVGNKLDRGISFGYGTFSDFVVENNILGGSSILQAHKFNYADKLDSYRFENNTINGRIYTREDQVINLEKNFWVSGKPIIKDNDSKDIPMNRIQVYPKYTDSTMTTLSFEGAKIVVGDQEGMKRGYASENAQYVVSTTVENDTVTLGAGTFNGFNVSKKGVSVMGAEEGKSIIKAAKQYDGASIVYLSNENVSLKNVSIRADSVEDRATAIYASGNKDSIVIDNCNMEDTKLYQGIYSEGDKVTKASLLIKNCTIAVNFKNILMAIRANVSLIDNTFKGADISFGYGIGGHKVEGNTFTDCTNKIEKGVDVKRNKIIRTRNRYVWEKRPREAIGVIDASRNYWGAPVPDFASLISDFNNVFYKKLSVNPFPYYEDEAMTKLSYKGAKIIITDANGNVIGGFADVAEAVAAAKDGDVIGLSKGTYSNDLNINKSISIVGLSSDSSLVTLTGIISIPDTTIAVRRVINLNNLSIKSVPADGYGMIDITGSNIDLNIDNVGMINAIAGTNSTDFTKFGIVTNGPLNPDSVLINFVNSSLEGQAKNQRGIVTKEGKNHRINVINSYIFSPNGSSYTGIYGVSTASTNSELYIDNSTIDVGSYAACLRNSANQKMTVKNSKLTGWAAIYVEGFNFGKTDTSINLHVESPIVRIENSTLNQRSYWTGSSDGFGTVVFQGATNVDAMIHNTIIKQDITNKEQKVIHLSDEYYTEKISGKLALTGTTTLIRNSDANSDLFNNPVPSQFTVTADPTVRFSNADASPINEVTTAMVETTKPKTLLAVSASMINAFTISNANTNSFIYSNTIQSPEAIADEVNAVNEENDYKDIFMIVDTQYIVQNLDSALTYFKAGKSVTWFDYGSNNFEAKTVKIADIKWNLPAVIAYNTPFTDPASTTSTKKITYTVNAPEVATIKGTTITPYFTGKLTATIADDKEIIGNTSTVDMNVVAKKINPAQIIVEGMKDEFTFTGANVTENLPSKVTVQEGEDVIDLVSRVDYTVRFNVKDGADITPINVGTYMMTLELKGSRYAYSDLTNKFHTVFKIIPKEPISTDINVVTSAEIVYGTALKNVAITCDNTKGTVAWISPETVLTAGNQTAGWTFTSTNANYKNLTDIASINVLKRRVFVVVADTAIAQGNTYIDSSYSFVNYIDNGVDTVKTIALATDYTVDSKIGDVAKLYIDSTKAEKIEKNQTFFFQKGNLLVGEPTLDAYTYSIESVAYGSKLKDVVITTTAGKGWVRLAAGQENLMPTVAGIDANIEYVLYGKVADTKTIKVKATKKAATLTIDNKAVVVRDAIPGLTASVSGLLEGESLNYALSTTYRSDIMVPGIYPIIATMGTNANYEVTVVAGNITSTQIEMTNIAVTPFTTTYNGKEQVAMFTIKDGARTLSLNDDYTMANASKKDVGQSEVIITFKGRYMGMTKAILTVKVAKLTATLDIASNPYSGVVQVPVFNFKQADGVVVTFVTPADYNIVEAKNATIQNAGEYSVMVTTKTANIELTSISATYTISALQAAFKVINKVQTFEEENYPSKQYTAKVTSALSLMKSEDFDVRYGGASFDEGRTSVTDSGIFQIWAKVKDTNKNFIWNSSDISLGKLEVKDLQIAEVFFTELSGIGNEIQKEIIESGAGVADSIIITAQAVGPIGDDPITVDLNMSGMAKKGINYMFENGKESFEFTRTQKTDTIRVIILDDSKITGDLTAMLDLTSSNPAMIVRTKQANFTLTIKTLKNVVATTRIGFENTEIEASTAVSEYPFAVIGKDGVTAMIKVAGAVLGKDVQIRDINKNIVPPTANGCPIYIDGANIGVFTLENINNDLVKVDAKKVITLTIAKASTTSSDIVVIESAKRSVKLILTNTSPVAFSDEFAYEANEATDNEDIGSFLSLNVIRNDMAYGKVPASALYVRGVRKIGESTFKASMTDDFNGTVALSNDGKLIYTFNKDAISAGYVVKFEYELAQQDAGLSTGTVALTIAPSVVRGESIAVKLPEVTNNKKPSLSGEYIDPFSAKASAKNKVKKIAVKVTTPKASESTDSIIVQINANLKGYDNRVLTTARKNGQFLSSMYNEDSELFYSVNTAGNFKAANRMGGRTVQVADTVAKLLQVRKLGISIKAKSSDSNLTEITFSPAQNTKLADSVITNDNNELFAPIYLCYSQDKKGRVVGGQKAITLEGDFFGPKAKFYFEYFDGKRIKKATLSIKRSIIVYTNENIRYTLKRTKIVPGKNQQEWLMWPVSLEKLINSGRAVDGRFDLIIDNGSMLNTIPNFDVKRIIDYKTPNYK